MNYKYSEHKLENGLRLLLVPSKTVNSVTISARLQAGSAYESKSNNGITHFLEHVAMTATKKWPDKYKLNEFLEYKGAYVNAYTSRTQLKYFINLPKINLETGLDFIHEVLFNSTLNENYIELERQIILDELAKYEDNVYNKAYDFNLKQILPKNNPYSYKIIGTLENLKRINRKNISSHYKKFHDPSNIHLSVVGNFNEKIAYKYITDLFNNHKDKGLNIKNKKINIAEGLIRTKYDKKSDLILGDIGFALPDRNKISYKERQILNKIRIMLVGPMSSRLKKRLREKEGLLYSMYGDFMVNDSFGYFVIGFECPPKIYKKVLTIILEELKDIYNNGFTETELKHFKEYSKNRSYIHYDDIYSYSNGIIEPASYKNEKIHTLEELINIFDKSTTRDLHKIIKKYLNPQKANIFAYGKINSSTDNTISKIKDKI